VFDTLPGLFLGIATSLILLLYRSSRPRIAELGKVPGSADQYADIEKHPENEVRAGIVIVRVESGLFFANADWVRAHLRRASSRAGTKAIVLDASSVPFLDVTAAEMLGQTADELHTRGVELLLARDIGVVRDVLRRAEAVGEHHQVYPSVQAAIDAQSRGLGGAELTPTRKGTA
jgi:SulP family sulfate permease